MSEENMIDEEEKAIDSEVKEYVTFEIKLQDGSVAELAVVDEFEYDKKNYVAAAQVINDTISSEGLFIYKVLPGNEFAVAKITDPKEYEAVTNAYLEL